MSRCSDFRLKSFEFVVYPSIAEKGNQTLEYYWKVVKEQQGESISFRPALTW